MSVFIESSRSAQSISPCVVFYGSDIESPNETVESKITTVLYSSSQVVLASAIAGCIQFLAQFLSR